MDWIGLGSENWSGPTSKSGMSVITI